jgi:hypothetical protein
MRWLLVVLLITGSVYASALNEQDQGQAQGQLQGQLQGQAQGQGQAQIGINDNDNKNTNVGTNVGINENKNDNRSSAKSTAIQGQLQGNKQETNIGGDTEKTYYMAAPAQAVAKGVDQGAIYSIFGGVNLSQTEEYQVCIEKLNTIVLMKANGFLSSEDAAIEAKKAFAQLKDSSTPKRILMVGPKTRGRHLLNAFGLLANDSWVNEDKVNDKVQAKELGQEVVRAKTVDEGVTGNGGNVNR